MEKYLKTEFVLLDEEDFEGFWVKMKPNVPKLYDFIYEISFIPVSNANVERSFRIFRKILTIDRLNLKEETLETMTMIYFNKKESISQEEQDEELI